MERLARRDQQALEAIYDRYSRAAYSLLLRITRDPAAAEELLQEAFLRLWRNAHSYDVSRGSLGTWLLTVARNMAFDHLRSKGERQRQREDLVDALPAQAVAPRSEEWLDLRRKAEHVRQLIGELPSTQRQALELAYFEGMTQSEIAQAMNEPLGTVKTWVRTALQQLRRGMEGVS
jgi:RNA polymerase sigma-70 factor (ECF subfamily)